MKEFTDRRSPKPLTLALKEKKVSRSRETVISIARKLARHDLKKKLGIKVSDESYFGWIKKLNRLRKRQTKAQRKKSTCLVQKEIVNDNLPIEAMRFVECSLLKETRTHRNGYQSLSKKERNSFSVGSEVTDENKEKLKEALRARTKTASKPVITKQRTTFRPATAVA